MRAYAPLEVIFFRPYFIWEMKIFKSNGFFFTKICQELISPKLNSTLSVLPIAFNSHKFSLVRYVFVENSGRF